MKRNTFSTISEARGAVLLKPLDSSPVSAPWQWKCLIVRSLSKWQPTLYLTSPCLIVNHSLDYKHQLFSFCSFVKHSEGLKRTKPPTFYLKSLQSWWLCTQHGYYLLIPSIMSKGLDKGRHHKTEIFCQGWSLQKNFQGFLIALQSDHGYLKTSIRDYKCPKNLTKVDTYISDHFIWTALQKPPYSWHSTSTPCPWDQPSATICTNICHWSFLWKL